MSAVQAVAGSGVVTFIIVGVAFAAVPDGDSTDRHLKGWVGGSGGKLEAVKGCFLEYNVRLRGQRKLGMSMRES